MHFNNVLCPLVVSVSLLYLFLYKDFHFFFRLAFQQRTNIPAHVKVLADDVGSCIHVHRFTLLVQVIHIVEEARSTSTAGNNDVLKLCNLVQHVAFYDSEPIFAPFFEYLGYSFAHACLYIPVQIVESEPQDFRQSPTERGFSGAHIAYYDYAFEVVW